MKFLQEMIAKKRQAQASEDAAPEPAEGGGFVLPQMASASGEASALPQARAPEPAPVIPIRQPEAAPAAAHGQPQNLDWDVSSIDLRAGDGVETASRVPPMSPPSLVEDEMPEVDPLEAIREEFGDEVVSEETDQPEDTGPLRLEPQDRVVEHEETPEEAEPSLSAAIMAAAEEAEAASDDETDELDEAPAALHDFRLPDAAPEEHSEEDLQDAQLEEHQAEDAAPARMEEHLADDAEDAEPEDSVAETVAEPEFEAVADTPVTEEDEYEAPAGFAAPDGGDEDEEDADMATHETQHKTAAEAAAALAQQFQQRKIWDLQPAQPEQAAADTQPEPRPEPEVETVPLSSGPTSPSAPASDSLARMPVPPMAPLRPTPQPAPQPAPPMQSAPPTPRAPEPAPEPQAARPEPENDDALMAEPQPRRRAGRVKTRLLGFHKPDAVVDPDFCRRASPRHRRGLPRGLDHRCRRTRPGRLVHPDRRRLQDRTWRRPGCAP